MAAPTKNEWISYPMLRDTTVISHVRLPNPTAAGDTIILVGQFGAGTDVISSIVDDKTNTWVKDKVFLNTTDNQSLIIARASNVAAGTRSITINFSAATSFTQFAAYVANNIVTTSPLDGTPVAQRVTATTAWSAGNITTTQADSFVVLYAVETSADLITQPTTFTPASGWTLWGVEPIQESTGACGTFAAGTFAASVTASRSATSAMAAAVAYKTTTGVGGSPGTKIEARQVQIVNFNNTKDNFGTRLAYTFNVPCRSGINLVAFSFDDGDSFFTTPNVSSSPANTWSASGGATAAGIHVGFSYAANATVSETMTITVTLTGTPTPTVGSFLLSIWGIANAAVSPLEQYQPGTGNLASVPPVTLNNVLTTPVTTTQADELILFILQEAQQTVTNITATNGTPLILMPDAGVYEYLQLTHDEGSAHLYATTPTTYNFHVTWSNYEGGLQVGAWAAEAIAFKSVAAAAAKIQRLMMLGAG